VLADKNVPRYGSLKYKTAAKTAVEIKAYYRLSKYMTAAVFFPELWCAVARNSQAFGYFDDEL
jgi:hypothetical protein